MFSYFYYSNMFNVKLLLLISLIQLNTHEVSLVWAECPTGWSEPKNSSVPGCFMFKKVNASWGYAQSLCKSSHIGSTLPFFKDPIQIDAFKSITPQLYEQAGKSLVWLGGYKDKLDDMWKNVDRTLINTSSTGWMDGILNGTSKKILRCLAYNISKNDAVVTTAVGCQQNASIICYLPDPKTQFETPKTNIETIDDSTVYSITCPKSWKPLGRFCYIPVVNSSKNYKEASEACAALDSKATLPRFYTNFDWNIFIKFMSDKNQIGDHLNTYIDGKRQDGSKFAYDDKTVEFTNWNSGQPGASAGDCIMYSDVDGYRWSTTQCTAKLFVVCQVDGGTPTLATIQNVHSNEIGNASYSQFSASNTSQFQNTDVYPFPHSNTSQFQNTNLNPYQNSNTPDLQNTFPNFLNTPYFHENTAATYANSGGNTAEAETESPEAESSDEEEPEERKAAPKNEGSATINKKCSIIVTCLVNALTLKVLWDHLEFV